VAGVYLRGRAAHGRGARLQRRVGHALLAGAPWLMKGLSVAGTAAMFLVGGAIVMHGIHVLQPHVDSLVAAAATVGGVGPVLAMLAPLVANAAMGLLVGAVVLALVSVGKRLLQASRKG
jgi:predicted DNA repair protein MutK